MVRFCGEFRSPPSGPTARIGRLLAPARSLLPVTHTPVQPATPPPPMPQAANLWGQGVDKLPLWGRYKWVEDHLAQVVGEESID